ncbi:MAG: AAA family ATPase [Cycloclasticus sp.]
MYLDYFGLQKQPFGITLDTSLFFKGAERGDILEAILYALNSGEGIIKVVGEVGSGKTMLSRMLTKKAADNTVFVFLLNPSIQAEQVLYAIAYDLGLKVDASDQSIQVLHELQKKLFELYKDGKKVVLIIDEAQQMPLATLEEIRLLSNLETETEKLLQIIMFGQPELDKHIDTVEVRQLRERITYSFYLNPLTWNLAETYLSFRLEKAGHQGRDIFKRSAIKKLTKYSDGTLRRLNVLADKALLAAYLDKSAEVEPKHVKIALQEGNKRNDSGNTAYVMAFLSVVAVLLGVGAFYWFVQFQPVSLSGGAKQPIAVAIKEDIKQEVVKADAR